MDNNQPNSLLNRITVHSFRINDSSLVRIDQFEGREHTVAPVVAVVEGVLNGELVLAEEFGKFPAAWNGIPLPVNHPMEGGVPVSANSPALIESQSIGRLFNVQFDGRRLLGEIWIDNEKAKNMGGEALLVIQKLKNGEPLEVSTAYFNDLEQVSGTFNGEHYAGIQRNLRPDHLALLPNDIGACNWIDGCGAPRINHSKGGEKKNMFEKLKSLIANFTGNQGASNRELADMIEQAMTRYTGDNMRFIVRDIYAEDKFFAYQESTNTGFDGRMFKMTYTLDANGKIELGTATEVVRRVNYEPVQAPNPGINANENQEPNANKDTEDPNKNKPAANANTQEGVESPMKNKIIDSLIANSATIFTEADKPWLNSKTECELRALAANSSVEVPAAPAASGTPAAAPTPNAEVKPQTMAEYVAGIPDPDLRDFIVNSQNKQKLYRESLVKAITDNKESGFSAEDLTGMSVNHLEKIAKISTPAVDFSGMGFAGRLELTDNSDNSDIPEAPSLILAKTEDKK